MDSPFASHLIFEDLEMTTQAAFDFGPLLGLQKWIPNGSSLYFENHGDGWLFEQVLGFDFGREPTEWALVSEGLAACVALFTLVLSVSWLDSL